MKITLIANDTTFIYNLRREVLIELIGRGHQVSVLCQPLSHADELEALGCKLYDVPIGRRGMNPLDDLKLMGQFRRVLREIKPDVVLTNNIMDPSAGFSIELGEMAEQAGVNDPEQRSPYGASKRDPGPDARRGDPLCRAEGHKSCCLL